jgi:hypothetical protein
MKLLFASILLFSFSLIRSSAQEIRYSVCGNCWQADSLGNHRAVVRIPQPGTVAKVTIPWRRRDMNPQEKNIIVTDERGNRINNIQRGPISRESGEVYFEPLAGAGIYYCYYLPYQSKGRSNYPVVIYPPFKETAAAGWKSIANSGAHKVGEVVEIQSIDELNSFYPMEVIATDRKSVV